MTQPKIVDPYCRACKTALATFTDGATGNRTYLHELQPPDGHEPDGLPRKATNKPRRLATIRGQMRAVYEPLLETLGERTAVPPGAPEVTA